MEFGKCLCGAIEYTSIEVRSFQLIMSCKDCQRATGSGKATIIIMSKNILRLIKTQNFEVQGEQGNHVVRGFCPNCGSGCSAI